MSPNTLSIVLQLALAAVLLNVWLVRRTRPTPYRGGGADDMKDEFEAYGLPQELYFMVGFLKIGIALLLVAGIWFPTLVPGAAALLSVLMAGAILMHVRVGDPVKKSVPAVTMLAMTVGLLIL